MNTNKIYASMVNLFTLFPLKKNRVTLVEKINTGGTGSLFSLKKECEQRGMNLEFNIIRHSDYEVSLRNLLGLILLFTRKAYGMATSSYIFLNDNFMPLGYMKKPEGMKIIQLWHGMGSFKKFGGSSESEEVISLLKNVNENVDCILASSENIVKNYAEAFCVPEDKIKVISCPQVDYYFQKHNLKRWREQLEKRYPAMKGKKLALYAPTFRGEEARDKELLSHFDFERFQKELGDEYCLMVRLHPQIQSDTVPDSVIDMTNFKNVRQLLLLTDLLIADYSSIAVEYALLERPILIYAYDKDWYLNQDRGFYFDFEETAPGPISEDMDQLLSDIKEERWDLKKVDAFVHLHNDFYDADSAKRLVDYFFE